jgi:ATP-dependent Lon protease
VILPSRNERDLRDVPEETRNALQWRLATRIDEVLETALAARPAGPQVPAGPGPEAHPIDDLAARAT